MQGGMKLRPAYQNGILSYTAAKAFEPKEQKFSLRKSSSKKLLCRFYWALYFKGRI